MYTTVCKVDSSWEASVWPKELSSGLRDDPGPGMRGGGGREGGDVYMLKADSCSCTPGKDVGFYPNSKRRVCIRVPAGSIWVFKGLGGDQVEKKSEGVRDDERWVH